MHIRFKYINAIYFQRISNPDFNFITNYKQFLKNDPNAQIYLIDPRSIWRLWKILQHDTKNGITKNPPSSGFIGNDTNYY